MMSGCSVTQMSHTVQVGVPCCSLSLHHSSLEVSKQGHSCDVGSCEACEWEGVAVANMWRGASLPSKFAGCFTTFYPGVHWQNFVIPKQLCDVLLIFSQDIIVECSRCQRKCLNLVDERLDYLQEICIVFWVPIQSKDTPGQSLDIMYMVTGSSSYIPLGDYDLDLWQNKH